MKNKHLLSIVALALVTASAALAQQTDPNTLRAVPAAKPVTIDGNLDEWDLSGRIEVYFAAELRERFSARIAVMYDRKGLYVGVDWTDQTPLGNVHDPAGDMARGWAGDALQLRIGTDRITHVTAWHYAPKSRDVLHLAYGKNLNEGEVGNALTQGAQEAFARRGDGKGYVQEIFLPWSLITHDGQARGPGDVMHLGVECLWGQNDTVPEHRLACNSADGQLQGGFFFSKPELWAVLPLSDKGGLPPLKLAGSAPSLESLATLTYRLDEPSYVTLVIEDETGRRLRNLVAAARREAGEQREAWDGLDDAGNPVPPGNYRWRGLQRSQPVTSHFRRSFFSPGNPPWVTYSQTQNDRGQNNQRGGSRPLGGGGWLSDHVPPHVVCAGNGRVYLGAHVAEAGHSIIEASTEGHKLWGTIWLNLSGADAIAFRDDVIYVAGEKGWMKDLLAVHRLDAKTHRYLEGPLEGYDRKETAAFIKVPIKDFSGIRGMAVTKEWVVLALSDHQRLALFTRDKGTYVRDIPLPQPGNIALDADDHLLAVSGKTVVAVDLQSGALSPVISKGLEEPFGLALDARNHIYVGDQAPAEQCVKVFARDGRSLRRIGECGGRNEGLFNPAAMSRPAGLAIDTLNQLWVAEEDPQVKRVSVWTTEGKLVRDFIGPPGYGGGGSVDPADDSRAFYNGMEFEIGDWPQSDKLKAVHFRQGAHPDLPLPLAYKDLNELVYHGTPQIAARRNGTLYLVSDGGWAVSAAIIVRVEKDKSAPQAILGQLDLLRKTWKELHPEYVAGLPRGKNQHQGVFLWQDVNGDGKATPEEVSLHPDWSYNSQWGYRIGPDLSVYVQADGAVMRIAPVSGAGLRYDPAQATRIPLPAETARKGIISLAADREGNLIINQGGKQGDPANVLLGLAPDGRIRWTYPNPFPSNTHDSPAPKLGDIQHTLGVEGIASVNDEIGDVFQLNGNKGVRYLFTTDGLFVDQAFGDMRLAPIQQSLPEARLDMRLDGMSLCDECFFGWLGNAPDGRVLQVVGKDSCSVLEMHGLQSLRRMKGESFQLEKMARVAVSSVERSPAAPIVLRLLSNPPQPGANWWGGGGLAAADIPEIKAFSKIKRVAQATLALDAEHLHLRVIVQDDSPFQNRGEDSQLLFKTGDAIDLQLGSSADASRKEPAAGDVRVLLALFRNQPTAVLYRYKVPGSNDPVKFASPTGVATVDQVKIIHDARIKILRTPGGYELIAALPRKALGLSPAMPASLRGDIGVILSDPSGQRSVARVYHFNQESQVVVDVPSEVRINPSKWGVMELIRSDAEQLKRGAALYLPKCLLCHQGGGLGMPPQHPPLVRSDWLAEDRSRTIRVLCEGLSGPITVNGRAFDNLMPAQIMDDGQVADVLTYVGQSWGNKLPAFTPDEVKAVRAKSRFKTYEALVQATASTAPLLQRDDRIVFIGDSITGLGWNNGQGFIHQIETALREKWPEGKQQVVPLGGSGQSVGSWQGVEKMSRDKERTLDAKDVGVKAALDRPADVVVVMLGMNDLLAPYVTERAEDLEAWADRYKALVTALRERVKPRIIALATISLASEDPASPKNRVRDALNSRLAKLATAEHCVLLPVGEAMLAQLQKGRARLPDFHVTYDYVHPNQHGHRAIAIGMLKGLGEHEAADKITENAAAAIDREAAAKQAATPSTARPAPAPWLVGTGVLNPQAWPANTFDAVKGRLPCDAAIAQGHTADATIAAQSLRWQVYIPSVNFTGGADPASVDFTAASFGVLHEAGYAIRWIHSDKDRAVRLRLGTQTFAGTIGLTAWLNAGELYANAITAEPKKQIHLDAKLQRGWNCLVLKCNHLTWQWQVSAGLEGMDGDDLSDLRYSAKSPDQKE